MDDTHKAEKPPVASARLAFDDQLRALNEVLQSDPVIGPWAACTGSNKPHGCACHMVWSRAWDFPILHTLSHKDESYTCGEGLVEEETQKLARYVALLDPEFVRDLVMRGTQRWQTGDPPSDGHYLVWRESWPDEIEGSYWRNGLWYPHADDDCEPGDNTGLCAVTCWQPAPKVPSPQPVKTT